MPGTVLSMQNIYLVKKNYANPLEGDTKPPEGDNSMKFVYHQLNLLCLPQTQLNCRRAAPRWAAQPLAKATQVKFGFTIKDYIKLKQTYYSGSSIESVKHNATLFDIFFYLFIDSFKFC